MELIKSVSKRGLVANILHILFNILFVAAIFGLIAVFPDNPGAALGLVIIAKWRIFAVRPRYWAANILANIPDLVLGLGATLLMWIARGNLAVEIILALLYMGWLVFLKPMHKHSGIVAQAGISQFVALSALFAAAHILWLPFVILICFVIGFSTARHVLISREEEQTTLMSMAWGVIVAELGFVAYHWTVGYVIVPGALEIPQIAIIITTIALVVERCFESLHKYDKVRWIDIRLQVLFAVLLIGILLFLFSGLNSASQL